LATNPWGDRPLLGRKEPSGKGGHARDARGVQDPHLRDLHHGAHSLLRRDLVQDWERPPPYTKEVKESWWAALVTKLLRTILKEVHMVRQFAAEAVSIGTDSLTTNGMFLYAALEELPRILYATCLKPACLKRCLRTGRRGRGCTLSRSMPSRPLRKAIRSYSMGLPREWGNCGLRSVFRPGNEPNLQKGRRVTWTALWR
jgi:hypothetical protein